MDEKRKEIYITIIVVISIIIVSTIVYFYLPSGSEDDGNDVPNVDRSIKFPEDEGEHNEFFEIWEFFTEFTTHDDSKFYLLVRCTNFSNSDTVRIEYQLRDITNKTGDKNVYRYLREGHLKATDDEMNMTYKGGNTEIDMRSTGRFMYESNIIIDEEIVIQIDIQSEKTPILFGDKGKIYHPTLGTIFGYYQSNLEVQGSLSYDGGDIGISGKGWLEHTWGGEIKSITKEEWQIQLDNSVEIFLSKIYDPQKEYPEDLYFHVLNIVRNDGDLITPSFGNEVILKNMRYKIIPADYDLRKRAWSYRWRLEGENINLTIVPSSSKNIHNWTWLGFCEVTGMYYGESVDGYGTCELTRRYTSDPQIEELEDDFNSLYPTDPVNVFVNISYHPPIEIEEIQLRYHIKKEGWQDYSEWSTLDMDYEEGYWKATIPPQPPGTTIQYKIYLLDKAEKEVESDIQEYVIPYT